MYSSQAVQIAIVPYYFVKMLNIFNCAQAGGVQTAVIRCIQWYYTEQNICMKTGVVSFTWVEFLLCSFVTFYKMTQKNSNGTGMAVKWSIYIDANFKYLFVFFFVFLFFINLLYNNLANNVHIHLLILYNNLTNTVHIHLLILYNNLTNNVHIHLLILYTYIY